MTLPDVLLAKSRVAGRGELTLEQHLVDTERAAVALFSPRERLSRNWQRFFRMQSAEEGEAFLLHVRAAGLLHDLGKANADFYRAVTRGDPSQTIRHEHLSAILLFEPRLREWLAKSSLDLDVVTAAVLSHHMKASRDPQSDRAWCRARGAFTEVELYLGHAEVARVLERLSALLALPPPPAMVQTRWSTTSPWAEWWREGIQSADRFSRALTDNNRRRALLLATKVGVIAADAVASASFREGLSADWVTETVHRRALTEHDIEQSILRPRAQQLSARRGIPFEYHRFQTLAAEQGDRTLLLAACGAGKTVAAWKWAAACATRRQFGRVIFLYPTRGTATEGFRDYVGWAPEGESALVHGTARYELEMLRENPPEAIGGKDPRLSETEARRFSLGLWGRRYFSATVDQFLSFLEHVYSSVCLLPLLADSALIIDEVHSFDRRMFDDLVAFLRAFDVPVLCMTATLGASRRRELEDAGLSVFPRPEHRIELTDLEEQEQHPRYVITREPSDTLDALVTLAVDAVRRRSRVLWVVNTVARCQALSARLNQRLGAWPLVYHSRFRLKDRQTVHGRVVDAFQTMQPAVAVTTQVCEMSLDLDADLLLTELAPVSSLVQRFGRSNRHRARGDAFRARIHVYPPESALPYERDELSRSEQFVRSVEGETSQRGLADALERFARTEPVADGSCRFLESGYFAVPGPFRDGDERAGPCVLDVDLVEVEHRIARRNPWNDLVLSVPTRAHASERPSWLPRHVGVVPASSYDPTLGFMVS